MNPTTPELWQRHRLLEAPLLGAVLAISLVVWSHGTEQLLLLHLYYLPVVIAGFYLGRSAAGVLALFCALSAGLAIFSGTLLADSTSLEMLCAVTIWGATLGLTAILTGTLSDIGRRALHALGEAHKEEVLFDPLTRVLNRRGLEQSIERRMAQPGESGEQLCLAIVDIDHFKNFNDRHGHQTGDAILAQVAQLLQSVLRDGDSTARYGGEEFALILPAGSLEQNMRIVERTRLVIETGRLEHDGLKHRLTVSIGMAQLMPEEDMSSLFQRADAALYCSKESGRNCAHFHDGGRTQPFGTGLVAKEPVDSGPEVPAGPPHDVYSDETTGLPTLKVFVEEFRRRVSEAQRYGVAMTVALIEVIDYRESHGQRAHHHVLRTVARLTGSVLRESDLIVRHSQNRFCVLMPWTSNEQAAIPLGRLRENAALFKDAQYESISFAVAIGQAQVLKGDHAGAVLQRAEAELVFEHELLTEDADAFYGIAPHETSANP